MTTPELLPPLLELRAISRTYAQGAHAVLALREIDLHIQVGETLAIVGASGSGKSTLLNILGMLDSPSSGGYFFREQNVVDLDENQRADLRNRALGFVFQQCHLVPYLNCLQNASLPLLYRGADVRLTTDAAADMLQLVGLGHRMTHRPSELSGGERQRVALARALIGKPQILLADEPTGALDSATGRRILELMLELTSEVGSTLIMVTHDHGVAKAMRRQIHMKDGVMIQDSAVERLLLPGESHEH